MRVDRELRLASSPDTVPRARRFAVTQLHGQLPAEVVADAELAVSELVTNAVLHAGTTIVVRLRVLPASVRIEVEDSSRVTPVRPLASAHSMTGRGLALVESISSAVGVDRTSAGKVVWCVVPSAESPVETPAPAPQPAEEELIDAILDNWDPAPSSDPDHLYAVSLGDVPTELLLAAKEHMDNLGREFALVASGASTGESGKMPADMAAMVETVLHRFAAPRQAIKVQALAAAKRGDERTTLTLTLPLRAVQAGEAYLRALDQADAYARSAKILTLETPPQHRAFRRWYVESIIEQLHDASTGGTSRIQETFEQYLLRALDQVSAAQTEAEALASRLGHLQQLTAELTGVTEVEQIAEIMVGHAADAFGAQSAALYVREREELVSVMSRGSSPLQDALWTRVSLDEGLPICEALRENRPVVVRGADEITRRYPSLHAATVDDVSVACVPLQVGNQGVGVVALTFPLYRDPDDRDELAFLASLADACAQALDRARALAASREYADKLEFLADASAALASSVDARTTLRRITDLVVPRLADWCSIQIVSNGVLETVAIHHVDPSKVGFAEEWQRLYPPRLDDETAVARVIRTGAPELHPVITEELMRKRGGSEEIIEVAKKLQLSSVLVVPMTGAEGRFGAITLLYAESGRHYDEDDLLLATELGSRAALAVSKARQYDQQSGQLARITRIAETAQRAILAPVPARMGPLKLAGSYVSAAKEALIGGDLYEVVPGRNGVRLLIGDVRGKGLDAVRLATVVLGFFRTAAVESRNLGRLARQLDARLHPYLGDEDFATALMLEITPDGVCSLVSCGHPPPLLARDGELTEIACDPSPPLGVGARPVPSEIQLHRGDRLLLYTDGLIEARSTDGKYAELLEVARPLCRGSLGASLQGILTRLRAVTGPELNDDLALLAVEYERPGKAD